MPDIDSFRLNPRDCLLLVVDAQEKLMSAMSESVRSQVVGQILTLAETATRLDFPVLVTEQYPKGLGPTVDAVAAKIPDFSPIAKISFSCCGEEAFLPRLHETGRTKILLTGAETHVCCYQTALDLLDNGFIVHVVADALCSRSKLNWRTGLSALERAGAIPSTTEQVLFDLLRVAGTEDFKFLSKLIR